MTKTKTKTKAQTKAQIDGEIHLEHLRRLKNRSPEEWKGERDKIVEEFQREDLERRILGIYSEESHRKLREGHERRVDYQRELERYFLRGRRPRRLSGYPGWFVKKIFGF